MWYMYLCYLYFSKCTSVYAEGFQGFWKPPIGGQHLIVNIMGSIYILPIKTIRSQFNHS